MEQLKQHYEKAILGLAMLALVYSAYIVWIDDSKEKIEEQVQAREPGRVQQVKEMGKMDMSKYKETLARLEAAETLNLSNPHNLFNPVQWRVTRQGTTLKVELAAPRLAPRRPTRRAPRARRGARCPARTACGT